MNTLTAQLGAALLSADEPAQRAALRVLLGQNDPPERTGVEPFVSLREASRQIGISRRSLWRMGVPGHNFNGRRRFRVSEILAHLETIDRNNRATEPKAERQRSKGTRRAA